MNDKAIKVIDFSLRGRAFQISFYRLDQIAPKSAGELCQIYEIWNAQRLGEKIPDRRNITFEVLKGWHSNIRLVDLGTDILSPKRNLILGETYKKYWGNETMYSQFVESDNSNSESKKAYTEGSKCFMEFHYALSTGYAPHDDGSAREIAWIDLPLSSGDENKITHMLTALQPINEGT